MKKLLFLLMSCCIYSTNSMDTSVTRLTFSSVFPIALGIGIIAEYVTITHSLYKYPTVKSIQKTQLGKLVEKISDPLKNPEKYKYWYYRIKGVGMATICTMLVYLIDGIYYNRLIVSIW